MTKTKELSYSILEQTACSLIPASSSFLKVYYGVKKKRWDGWSMFVKSCLSIKPGRGQWRKKWGIRSHTPSPSKRLFLDFDPPSFPKKQRISPLCKKLYINLPTRPPPRFFPCSAPGQVSICAKMQSKYPSSKLQFQRSFYSKPSLLPNGKSWYSLTWQTLLGSKKVWGYIICNEKVSSGIRVWLKIDFFRLRDIQSWSLAIIVINVLIFLFVFMSSVWKSHYAKKTSNCFLPLNVALRLLNSL